MLNHNLASSPAPRISEILFGNRDQSFSSLAGLPSNVDSVEAGLQFSTGILSSVAVVGPSGWGKTHLLQSIANHTRTDRGVHIEPVSAIEYLNAPHRFDPSAPLLLDDVQDVLERARQKLALRIILERRVRASRPTVLAFTANKPNRAIRSFLPFVRDWRIVTMGEPAPAERVLLINKMAESEGLALSPRLVKVLANQMHGNGRTLSGALKRLRLSGTISWLETRDVLRALGHLEPFFADNSGWDLKMWIMKTAEKNRAHFSKVTPLDLALYTMLREAELPEADVCRVSGLSAQAVYQRTQMLQLQIQGCDITSTNIHQFVEWVVSAIAKD